MASLTNHPTTLFRTPRTPAAKITCPDCNFKLPSGPSVYINHLTAAISPRPAYLCLDRPLDMYSETIPLLFQTGPETGYPLLFRAGPDIGYKIASRPGCLANFNAHVRQYNSNLPLPLSATFRRADPRFSSTGTDYMLWGERRVRDLRPTLPEVEYDAIQTAIRQVPVGTPLEMLSFDNGFLYMDWSENMDVEREAEREREETRLNVVMEMSFMEFTEGGDFEVPKLTK
jgi:hypothetical protein